MPSLGWCLRWLAAARSSALEPELDRPISEIGCHLRDDSPQHVVIEEFLTRQLSRMCPVKVARGSIYEYSVFQVTRKWLLATHVSVIERSLSPRQTL